MASTMSEMCFGVGRLPSGPGVMVYLFRASMVFLVSSTGGGMLSGMGIPAAFNLPSIFLSACSSTALHSLELVENFLTSQSGKKIKGK